MNTDDKIRAILRMEADTVDPSPAGWDAIQSGIAARRSHTWWTRSAALAGIAAVVVGAIVYVNIDRSRLAIDSNPTSPGPSAPASPSPSPSAAIVPNEPIGAIWPLTTTREIAEWEADHETYPALGTASSSVLAFGRNYLGIADTTVVALEGSFGENRFEIRRDGSLVSRVTVKGFGPDGTSPFVVTLAEANDVRIDSPSAGDALAGPFTARGSFEAVDPAFDVVLRADTGGSAPVQLAKVRATTGPEGWTAPVTFATDAKTGSLLVTNPSLKDGGVASAAAIPVTFGKAVAAPMPATMIATRDRRVAVLSTRTGELIRWLTAEEPGGGAYDAELSDDGKTAVYSQGAGTCSAEIRSVPAAGGTPKTLVAGSAPAGNPSMRGDVLAYVKPSCTSNAIDVVVQASTRIVERVDGELVGGPVLGERFVAYVALKGSVTTLHTIDTLGELGDNPAAAPEGCRWGAVTWGPPDANERSQIFVATRCTPRAGGVEETWLYRLDADARNATRLTKLDVPAAVVSLDYAGDALVIGAGDAAYTYVGGVLRKVPGEALAPSWS